MLITKAMALVKGLDWNPFKLDHPDEFENAWKETTASFAAIFTFIGEIVDMVELAVKDLFSTIGSLNGAEKLEAAVEFLDDIVKLPFWLEWFDKPVFRLIISLVVGSLNKERGHLWDPIELEKNTSYLKKVASEQ